MPLEIERGMWNAGHSSSNPTMKCPDHQLSCDNITAKLAYESPL